MNDLETNITYCIFPRPRNNSVLLPTKCHFFIIYSHVVHVILMLFVNHVQQFKCLVKRMWNVNVNCGYLNLSSEGLTYIRVQSDLQVINVL